MEVESGEVDKLSVTLIQSTMAYFSPPRCSLGGWLGSLVGGGWWGSVGTTML